VDAIVLQIIFMEYKRRSCWVDISEQSKKHFGSISYWWLLHTTRTQDILKDIT